MADFWIKIEKSTPDKPEIFEMAELLKIDPDAVLGKLIRFWAWADSHSENGHTKNVTSVLIDRVTMSVGFSDALTTVGWLEENKIPNFERHLGESAKKRAKDSERKRNSRKVPNESGNGHKESVTEKGLDIDIDRDRDKINNKEDSAKAAPVKKFTDWDLEFSRWAFALLLENAKGMKTPNLESWAATVRLMRERDNRIPSEMGELWKWVRNDNFWHPNILSMSKFREKYDQLTAQSKRKAPIVNSDSIRGISTEEQLSDTSWATGGEQQTDIEDVIEMDVGQVLIEN